MTIPEWLDILRASAPRIDGVLLRVVAHVLANAPDADPLLWVGDALAEAIAENSMGGFPNYATELGSVRALVTYEAGRRRRQSTST
jgi:hypothetical protein